MFNNDHWKECRHPRYNKVFFFHQVIIFLLYPLNKLDLLLIRDIFRAEEGNQKVLFTIVDKNTASKNNQKSFCVNFSSTTLQSGNSSFSIELSLVLYALFFSFYQFIYHHYCIQWTITKAHSLFYITSSWYRRWPVVN